MKQFIFRVLTIICFSVMTMGAQAQGEAFSAVRAAIRSGSSRAVAQYFAGTVELGFDGDKQSFSATQAEFVLKDFFAKNGPASFELVHQGASGGGIQYAVGKFGAKSGNYRVFIKMKPADGGALQIDTMDFTHE
ncbi:DUF4783 domain-containing protein [Hymenobacter busanensis]|uniref:DUF4783 domain-containing protein n=1 Tax=Hymenobacter busanensis TaxID=2607656 RepID=A0A7L4ZYW1_9BACT|nr:DUF4783 domain-containing protein [Hymenobacter busanensis]KAA9333078.1 DUF4783 domain-containing protein [Hymenobacter busanensis]QHJ08247.1 DUF4783 domain-containing protein [Hymenobacter busanensis]